VQERFNNLKNGTYRFPPPIIVGPEEVWYVDGCLLRGIIFSVGETRILVCANNRLVVEAGQNNNLNNELN